MPKISMIAFVMDNFKNVDTIQKLLNQTYDDYEIIIADNTSTDKYKKEFKSIVSSCQGKVKYIHKKGMSLTRIKKIGIQKSKGEYILFIDSNDTVEKNLLKTLDKKLKDNPDIIRFQMKEIVDDNIKMYRELPFETVSGIRALEKMKRYFSIEKPGCYLYRKELLKNNLFDNKKTEMDYPPFSVSPFLIQAKKVKAIGYVGYVLNKTYCDNKNVECLLKQYKSLLKRLPSCNEKIESKYKEYLSDQMLRYSLKLDYKDYKKYLLELKQTRVFDYIHESKWKMILLKQSPKLYYKLVKTK